MRLSPILPTLAAFVALPPAWAQSPGYLVTACAVRLRVLPEVGSREVGRLSLGDELQVLEQSPIAVTLKGLTAPWLRVRTGEGREGWVFGAFLASLPPEGPEALLRQVLQARRDRAELPVSEWAETLAFLDRQLARPGSPDLRAELELARLEAVIGLLAALPPDGHASDKPPSHPALRPFEKDLVYSEPAGQWFLKAKVLWELHARHRDLPAGDRIAYAASRAPLPGETEGDLSAVLGVVRLTQGRYLEARPKGAFVAPTLAAMTGYLHQFLPDPKGRTPATWAKEDVPALRRELDTLMGLVRATGHAGAEDTLRTLTCLVGLLK